MICQTFGRQRLAIFSDQSKNPSPYRFLTNVQAVDRNAARPVSDITTQKTDLSFPDSYSVKPVIDTRIQEGVSKLLGIIAIKVSVKQGVSW
jgi:hypothetical protein